MDTLHNVTNLLLVVGMPLIIGPGQLDHADQGRIDNTKQTCATEEASLPSFSPLSLFPNEVCLMFSK